MFKRFNHLLLTVIACTFVSFAPAAEPSQVASEPLNLPSVLSEQNKFLARAAEQLEIITANSVGDAEKKMDELERTEREKKDLDAQVAMAMWAQAMFWATIFGSAVALASVGMLYHTLKQNATNIKISNDNLNLSRKTAAVQFRAYVGISIEESYKDLFNQTPHSFIEVVFKNHGATHARYLGTTVGTEVQNFDRTDKYEYEHQIAGPEFTLVLMQNSEIRIRHTFRDQMAALVKQVKQGVSKLHINAEVKYTDIFDNEYKTTYRFIIYCLPDGEVIGYLSDGGNSAT